MEDGNGAKRKVAIDFANLADDDLFSDDEPVANNTVTNEEVEAANDDAKGLRVKNYCFTWNNPTVDGEELEEKLKNSERVAGYAFQLEEGNPGHHTFKVTCSSRTRWRPPQHTNFCTVENGLDSLKAKIAKEGD